MRPLYRCASAHHRPSDLLYDDYSLFLLPVHHIGASALHRLPRKPAYFGSLGVSRPLIAVSLRCWPTVSFVQSFFLCRHFAVLAVLLLQFAFCVSPLSRLFFKLPGNNAFDYLFFLERVAVDLRRTIHLPLKRMPDSHFPLQLFVPRGGTCSLIACQSTFENWHTALLQLSSFSLRTKCLRKLQLENICGTLAYSYPRPRHLARRAIPRCISSHNVP